MTPIIYCRLRYLSSRKLRIYPGGMEEANRDIELLYSPIKNAGKQILLPAFETACTAPAGTAHQKYLYFKSYQIKFKIYL